jgi:hypothetical protein
VIVWPPDRPLPSAYLAPPRYPCPACLLVTLVDGRQAALLSKIEGRVARFRCRSCGHRWKLAVERRG